MKQNKALKETLGREISFDIYNRNIEDRNIVTVINQDEFIVIPKLFYILSQK